MLQCDSKGFVFSSSSFFFDEKRFLSAQTDKYIFHVFIISRGCSTLHDDAPAGFFVFLHLFLMDIVETK